jgi:hypothetical protein
LSGVDKARDILLVCPAPDLENAAPGRYHARAEFPELCLAVDPSTVSVVESVEVGLLPRCGRHTAMIPDRSESQLPPDRLRPKQLLRP